MINFKLKKFIKKEGISPAAARTRAGMFGGAVGILANILLFALKAIAGLISGSIAVIADAVNNLSDAASSVITFVSFRLSTKAADEDHPYGHGRIEYISGLIMSFIILMLGLSLVKSSVDRLLNPEPSEFKIVTVLVLTLSILIKLWLSLFFRRLGKDYNSTALKAAATDSLSDTVSTAAVLASTLVFKFTGLQIDGYAGLAVSIFIVVSGIKLVKETIDPLLGTPPERELTDSIIKKAQSYPGVIGIHDLVIHNYGPGRLFASMHVEVPADTNILISHDMVDNIERDFKTQMGLQMVIHMDPVVTNDPVLSELKQKTAALIAGIDSRLTIHDFRMVEGATHTNLLFDITLPAGFKMKHSELRQKADQLVKTINPSYYAVVTLDDNFLQS